MRGSLKDMVIVITGASSGAGRAMANALAAEGVILVLAARSEEALQEVAAECRLLGGEAHVVVTDTRDHKAMQELARIASALNGNLDAWINNAGVMVVGALDQVPPNITDEVIRTNLMGYIHGAQAVLPIFKRQGFGVLINNISVGGWLPTPYATAYSASKFGIRGFSEALKGEIKSYPEISIVDLYPGFLDTPGLQHAANYTGKVVKPAPPLGDPRDVANAVVKLLHNPKPRKTIGLSSAALRLSYALSPTFTRNMTGWVIRNYLKQAEETETTPGNILEPVAYGTSIDGGWRNATAKAAKLAGIGVLLSVGVGAFLIVNNYQKKTTL